MIMMKIARIYLICCFLQIFLPASGQEQFSSQKGQAWHRGVYEISLDAVADNQNPYYGISLMVTFTRPDGSQATAEGFHDGGTRFSVRAYCDQPGTWQWQSASNNEGLDAHSGSFEVLPSDFKGKLRQHPDDPYQFMYDNGEWFLHIGDTGYRYLVVSEPHWQAYIDQAAEMGATKIRAWFANSRHNVEALFTPGSDMPALSYWREMERRILYALEKYPHISLQVIPYAEDTEMIRNYADSRAAQMVGRYAQARWSAFPNVQWTISNDRKITRSDTLKSRQVKYATIDQMGQDFAAREPWGTLITNHQARFSGYDFVDAPWSDIITLEDLDEVAGNLILQYRKLGRQPIVLDEDRYELYRYPAHRRYFFRRLMWASLFSGGHATYGGLKTYERYLDHEHGSEDSLVTIRYQPFEGRAKGVWGYYDANRQGVLHQGAHDFRHIHSFFEESGLTLLGMQPDDALAGNQPARYKGMKGDNAYLIYLANPSGDNPETDFPATKIPEVSLTLPTGSYTLQWFDPDTGNWLREKLSTTGEQVNLKAPDIEDWVLWISRN
jgi:hypothetical protein